MPWGIQSFLGTTALGTTPVVTVGTPTLLLKEVAFAGPRGGSNWHQLWHNSSSHPVAPGDLQGWAKGDIYNGSEWVAGRAEEENLRACFTRNQPIGFSAKFEMSTTVDVPLEIRVTPKLDNSTSHLTPVTVNHTYRAGASEEWVEFRTGGAMPDEIGRYLLELEWRITGRGFTFGGPTRTRLRVYGIYGQPFLPAYDSPTDSDPGQHTDVMQGTLTGTKKRLDKFMSLIGRTKRHVVTTTDDVVDLLWKLHVGINDTPGAAPFFDAGHDEHMTSTGDDSGSNIDLEDQWLGWVNSPAVPGAGPTDAHWNDLSCIGHVQLLKTMAAAVGLFARRTWVFPTTGRLPDGSTPVLADTDLYCLGTYDSSRQQSWTFTHNGVPYRAKPKLMEPGIAWENFEACLRSPTGKFLPGGYSTSSCPASFRSNKGFNSARELLRWWSGTSRPGFGRRFMCWVYNGGLLGESHCWDVDGNHYPIEDYVRIRDNGKELPPP